MVKLAPKTSWCQACVEEKDDLRRYMLKPDLISWVCEECIKELEERKKKEGAIKPKKMTKKQREALDKEEAEKTRRQAERQRSRSSGERRLKPGEVLPESHPDFSFGSQPLRSKETPMDYYVGFKWSYGHGPNEEDNE